VEDANSKTRRADQIDVPALWVLVRGAQILLIVIYAKFSYLSLGTDSFVSGLISSIGFLLIIGAFVHGIATGTVDNSGIHYRRYFRQKTCLVGGCLGNTVGEIPAEGFDQGQSQAKKEAGLPIEPSEGRGSLLGAPLR
jgi:hypothetical protein